MLSFSKNLNRLRRILSNWNRNTLGRLNKRFEKVQSEILDIESKDSNAGLIDDEGN